MFIDEYTKREDFNEKNKEINNALSSKKMDIKRMNQTIEDYFTRSSLFLTSSVPNPSLKRTKSQDTKEKMAYNLNDPKYSIDYLEPSHLDIFAKTQAKIHRNSTNINREMMEVNYNSFMKRKEAFIEKENVKKVLSNSRSVDYFVGINKLASHKTLLNFNKSNKNLIELNDERRIVNSKEDGQNKNEISKNFVVNN